MCNLVNDEDKYALNLNENIVLLAQMNHVCNVLKKEKGMIGELPARFLCASNVSRSGRS